MARDVWRRIGSGSMLKRGAGRRVACLRRSDAGRTVGTLWDLLRGGAPAKCILNTRMNRSADWFAVCSGKPHVGDQLSLSLSRLYHVDRNHEAWPKVDGRVCFRAGTADSHHAVHKSWVVNARAWAT